MTDWHISRTWFGTPIEDACPCPQEPCGMVSESRADPECPHHPVERGMSIRRMHRDDVCLGMREDAGAHPWVEDRQYGSVPERHRNW